MVTDTSEISENYRPCDTKKKNQKKRGGKKNWKQIPILNLVI